ncbi:carbamate kinase [bacterium]|nr:carbamate kinase [candidate division CSSED10-310 bacterium]
MSLEFTPPRIVVIAIGGNALVQKGQRGTITEQFANTRRMLKGIIEAIKAGFMPVIIHGNGPQVGDALIRVETALDRVPEVPLGVLVADTEGSLGYMIAQSLTNTLRREGMSLPVTSVLTQVVVDRNDPALARPSKPIGPFYTKQEAQRQARLRNWTVSEDAGRGWRRLVPSPRPLEIVERDTIRLLIQHGVIVIAAGGGGVPVYVEDDGTLEGIDAVIDKDLSASVLGRDIGAQWLAILMSETQVAINYQKPNQEFLGEIRIRDAGALLEAGQFAEGSMAPKIRAAIQFLEWGGEKVFITDTNHLLEAFRDEAGTRIVP